MSEETNYVFKVLLLGDSTVGKTCFLMRFTENTFQKKFTCLPLVQTADLKK